MTKQVLFVIDPQNDFMASPQFTGSLAVQGSYGDMTRLSQLLLSGNFENLVITLDTHKKTHIAHQLWWVDADGKNPAPFTIISPEDVKSGKWMASDEKNQEWAQHYVDTLASKGKYPLCIWPFHCIEGTKGFDIEDTFLNAVKEWEQFNDSQAVIINKGHNDLTEHYSGLSAEVPVPNDPSTELNIKAIKMLNEHDKIFVAGEALSHCVAYTTLDLLGQLSMADRSKVVLLTDAMSPVTGFEKQGQEFLEKAVSMGASLANIEQMLSKNTKDIVLK